MEPVRKRKVSSIRANYINQEEQRQQALKKRKSKLFKRLTLMGIISIIPAFLICSTLIAQSSNLNDRLKEKEKLEAQLNELKDNEKDLHQEIVKLNDKEYIKQIARRDYFFSEEGEVIFRVSEDEASSY